MKNEAVEKIWLPIKGFVLGIYTYLLNKARAFATKHKVWPQFRDFTCWVFSRVLNLTYVYMAIRYIWITLTGFACWLFLYGLNKTYIFGQKRMPRQPNTLVIPNHQSLIDSWPLTYAAFFPWGLWQFRLMPWHTPEKKNFYYNFLLATMCWLSQCIPVVRGKTKLSDLWPIANKLKNGSAMMFLEGTRHRGQTPADRNTLYQWKHGPACLACMTRATVVPVAIRGMSHIWPVGQRYPWLMGRKIVIFIGEPVDLSQFWEQLGDHEFDPVRDKEIMLAVSEAMKSALQEALDTASEIFHSI